MQKPRRRIPKSVWVVLILALLYSGLMELAEYDVLRGNLYGHREWPTTIDYEQLHIDSSEANTVHFASRTLGFTAGMGLVVLVYLLVRIGRLENRIRELESGQAPPLA
jgi:hypothetical protein